MARKKAQQNKKTASQSLFLNRELSWLEFNRRVLHEACDPRTPLLERVRFLGIFTSNLDEYYMKRVGGLKRQMAAGIVHRSLDGMNPQQQLTAIRKKVLPMLKLQADCFTREIMPNLARHNIRLSDWENLTTAERRLANAYFRSRVFPVLTPLAVDPSHPFPFISNLSTSLGVILRQPKSDDPLFARVKIPKVLPQWISLKPDEGNGRFLFISLLELIQHNLAMLFPNTKIVQVMPFRITRNADIEREEEDAEDLLAMIEEEMRRRRFEKIVRLEHGPNLDREILDLLTRKLEIEPDDIYAMPAKLDYTNLQPIADLNIPELRFEPWTPVIPAALAGNKNNIFETIRNGDILVHHPYDDFSASTEQFVKAAADDPKVLAIKMVVYRTGVDSPFIHTLIRAAESGKQVVCLVELKARFDEERNIYWAQVMEKAGIHVVYGLVGLKTHTKTIIIIREEADGLRCYAHIGTGNYHCQTARLYTDFGLFTCRPEFTDDLIELFNYLTGRSLKREYRKLLIAPINMRKRFLQMIKRETTHQQAGRPALIIAKINSLEDDKICEALYSASRAGVEVALIVRGFCCLKPRVPGLSDRISVISVIGRYLEHSRIFYFRNGKQDAIEGEFYIGSADWMYRNLLARVELVAPIESRALREKCWEVLQILLHDERQAWEMHPDGSYRQRQPRNAEHALGTHQTLMNLTRQRAQSNQ